MSLATVNTRAIIGIDTRKVSVEVHLSSGLPSFSIVGLPETAVKESKDRVRSAILNSNFSFPVRKITVNLAPADLPKAGGFYDLPIALGILAASYQIKADSLANYEFIGELELSGALRDIYDPTLLILSMHKSTRTLVLPCKRTQPLLLEESKLLSATSLLEVTRELESSHVLAPLQQTAISHNVEYADFKDVHGQQSAKRVLEIAAAGGHSVLFSGVPGVGKTMLASRLPSILPPPTIEEAIEIAKIYALSKIEQITWRKRPFRAPHHTASSVALVGGGSNPLPGEITLAHHGVLFLDELPEFARSVLEVLREPLESHKIVISRAKSRVIYPANFQLIAAMNPCPCGYFGSTDVMCRCAPAQVLRYKNKISGPLLDRIDLQLEIMPVAYDLLLQESHAETSADIQKRVLQAQQLQFVRQGALNFALTTKDLFTACDLSAKVRNVLTKIAQSLHLSARKVHCILKVARTISDLQAESAVTESAIEEALVYRGA